MQVYVLIMNSNGTTAFNIAPPPKTFTNTHKTSISIRVQKDDAYLDILVAAHN